MPISPKNKNENYLLIVLIAMQILLFAGINKSIGEEIDYYSPDNTYKFAEYLYQEKDFERAVKEYERYLIISSENNDNVLYKIGVCYRNTGNFQKAISIFQKLCKEYPNSSFRFSSSYQIAYSYFISNQHNESIQYINQALKDVSNKDEASKLRILIAYNYLKQRQWASSKDASDQIYSNDETIIRLSSEIMNRSIEGMNIKRKSRFLASIMSAVVPGTGKMYCKQYGNGIYSFATIGATGLVAWRGFHNDGIKSVKGWIFGSLCAIFYTGNIYGSGISALAYNQQIEDEILIRLPLLPDEW